MVTESDPLLTLVGYVMYAATYVFYLIWSVFNRILFNINLMLALVSAVECLLIVGVLAEMTLRTGTCECLDVKKLLGVWKTILTAISLYALREGYSVLESVDIIRIMNGYEVLGILFLTVLIVGLYQFYRLLTEAVIEYDAKASV